MARMRIRAYVPMGRRTCAALQADRRKRLLRKEAKRQQSAAEGKEDTLCGSENILCCIRQTAREARPAAAGKAESFCLTERRSGKTVSRARKRESAAVRFMEVQWYPGHMAKTRRQLKETLSRCDFVVEILDARAPHSTLNPDLEEMFAAKRVFYVLNKADLADPKVTEDWVNAFRATGRGCASWCALDGSADALRQRIVENADDILQRFEAKGMHKTLRGIVAGVPNVGKSAILNRLLGRKKMEEGNRPGVTRSLQWAKINSHLEILDSPGMLWPKFEDEETGAVLALTGSVPPDVLNQEELAYYLLDLLRRSEPGFIADRYGVDVSGKDAYALLEVVCKKRGFLRRGGELDIERGASTLLNEFRNGRLGPLSLEVPSEYETARLR